MSPQAPQTTAANPIFTLVSGSNTDWILAIVIGFAIGWIVTKSGKAIDEEEGEEL